MTFSDDIPTVGDESMVNAERDSVGESSKLNEQMEIMQGKLSNALARIEEITNENDVLQSEVRNADDRNLDLSQDLENMQNDAKMAKGELETLQLVSETKAEELSKKNLEAVSEWTKYEEMATVSETKAEELSKKNLEAVSEWTKYEEMATTLEEEVNMLKKRLEDSEDIRNTLSQEKEGLKQSLEEQRNVFVALDANEAELKDEISETKDNLRAAEAKLFKTERALAEANRIIDQEGRVNWEEKCKEEMERREKVESDLWESRRLFKEEKKKLQDSEEHVVRVQKELDEAEKRRVKQEQKYQKEISVLWQKESAKNDKLEKAIDNAKAQVRSEDSQRITELNARLNTTTKDYNSLKNRLGTAERELANSKRKAKKQGGTTASSSASADFILVTPEPKAPESPVEEWKRRLHKVTWKQAAVGVVIFLLFLHIFFPKAVTTAKY